MPAEQTLPFAVEPRRERTSAEDILRMSEPEFAAFTEGSPMKRPGRAGLGRNAAIVLGNSGDRRHLPVLREVAREHGEELVREAAAWAADKLERTI